MVKSQQKQLVSQSQKRPEASESATKVFAPTKIQTTLELSLVSQVRPLKEDIKYKYTNARLVQVIIRIF